jgi:hypothetical protein
MKKSLSTFVLCWGQVLGETIDRIFRYHRRWKNRFDKSIQHYRCQIKCSHKSLWRLNRIKYVEFYEFEKYYLVSRSVLMNRLIVTVWSEITFKNMFHTFSRHLKICVSTRIKLETKGHSIWLKHWKLTKWVMVLATSKEIDFQSFKSILVMCCIHCQSNPHID